ncbi:HEAT repeat protein [Archangium gephyra]|uniref:HEAT repeat protein n=1 Tax=Archangium gephyra TaxID=48 RepID=A0AAC8THA4_9BACT|nr:HEAT repeat domain-containing protein [Archangium gephyra]AKJ06032.1 Hypothetical protein AA314_07658 [Archangium gephyra]REG27216.1 HEAT repeat protein [Archangium gephyra]
MSGKHSRPILPVIAVLVVLGLAGAWWVSSRGDAPVPTAVQPAAPVRQAPTAVAPSSPVPARKTADGTRAWIPGMLYRYALLSDQKVSFRQKQPGAATPPEMSFHIQGEWQVGIAAVDGERVDARVVLLPDVFTATVDGKAVATDVQRNLRTALMRPFYLTLDKTGAVKLTHFEQNSEVLSRGLLRALVASTQFVVPGAPKDTWKTEESDTTGTYSAVYQRLAAQRFEKKKQSYSQIATSVGLQPLESKFRIDVRSSTAFELAEDLWAQTIDATEELEVDSGSGSTLPPAVNENTVGLRLIERRMDPSLLGSLAARKGTLLSASLATYQGAGQDPLNHHRQVLGKRTFADILKALRSLPKEEKARDDARTDAMEQLRALFMLQPDEALKVPGYIREGMEPQAASPMLGALSAASTPQAIKALTEVTGDHSLSMDIRMNATGVLGLANTPTQEGVDALRSLSRDSDPMLRGTATLALGNASYQMSDNDGRGAENLVRELQNDYRVAPSPEQQIMTIKALGNTRSPSALATITEALRSNDAQVRAAAVGALRNVADPSADRILSDRLLNDPAVEVRRSAVFASSFRLIEPLLPALGQALRSDSSPSVRSDIIQLLGTVRGQVPVALNLLQWASQNDPYPDLRQAAQTYLDTPTTPVPSTQLAGSPTP